MNGVDGWWDPPDSQDLRARIRGLEEREEARLRNRRPRRPRLRELHDVAASEVVDGQTIRYSIASGRWEVVTPASALATLEAEYYLGVAVPILANSDMPVPFDAGGITGDLTYDAATEEVVVGAEGGRFDCEARVKLKLSNSLATVISDRYLAHLFLNREGASPRILDDDHPPHYVLEAGTVPVPYREEFTLKVGRRVRLVPGDRISVVAEFGNGSITGTIEGAAVDGSGSYQQTWLTVERVSA